MAKRKCPLRNELIGFIQHELAGLDFREIQEHVNECNKCCERIKKLFDRFILKSARKRR